MGGWCGVGAGLVRGWWVGWVEVIICFLTICHNNYGILLIWVVCGMMVSIRTYLVLPIVLN